MAEIEINKAAAKNKKLHKKSTGVDLTPMVDLGFLLITFFVFTTSMTLPKVMGLNEPKGDIKDDLVCNSCVLTVLLEKNNTITYYEGMPEANPEIKQTSFIVNGIRKVLQDKIEKVKMARGNAKQFVLIIKPGAESTMQNFVDMMDEVAINDIKRYYLSEINDADRKLLSRK
jgi:biopolymer transport protein ExbD